MRVALIDNRENGLVQLVCRLHAQNLPNCVVMIQIFECLCVHGFVLFACNFEFFSYLNSLIKLSAGVIEILHSWEHRCTAAFLTVF